MTHDFKGQASKYKLILSSEELGFQHVIWCVCVWGGEVQFINRTQLSTRLNKLYMMIFGLCCSTALRGDWVLNINMVRAFLTFMR